MKNFIFSFCCFIILHSSAQDESLSIKPAESGNRRFGIGFNYTSPAPGLSAKISAFKHDHIQLYYSEKSYQWNYYGLIGWGYKWNFLGAEYQHRFDPILWHDKIQIFPLIYGGVGIGKINWNENYLWYFGSGWEKKQEWYGYNLGGGVEMFPSFFKNNMGFTMKLGFGSYATANALGYSANGGALLFTGSVHYYIF
jgi:hypothetical protein